MAAWGGLCVANHYWGELWQPMEVLKMVYHQYLPFKLVNHSLLNATLPGFFFQFSSLFSSVEANSRIAILIVKIGIIIFTIHYSNGPSELKMVVQWHP